MATTTTRNDFIIILMNHLHIFRVSQVNEYIGKEARV